MPKNSNKTVEKQEKLQESDIKAWLIFGIILVAIAIFAKLILIAGLVIIVLAAFYLYRNKGKTKQKSKK